MVTITPERNLGDWRYALRTFYAPRERKLYAKSPVLRAMHLAAFLALLTSLGCGSTPQKKTELEWAPMPSSAQTTELREIDALLNRQELAQAAQKLKNIRVTNLDPTDHALFTFLTARVALASKGAPGCRMMANFAKDTTSLSLKKRARNAALLCLKAPRDCSEIVELVDSELDVLISKVPLNQLRARGACPPSAPVLNALKNAKHRLAKTNSKNSGLAALLDAATLVQLQAVLAEVPDAPFFKQTVIETILTKHDHHLTEDTQQQLVKELSANNPIRLKWHRSSSGGKVLFCAPLSGPFASLGLTLSEQLKQLSSVMPKLFSAQLAFLDCSDDAWSTIKFESKLSTFRPTFIFSITSSKVQKKLRLLLERSQGLVHFTLNPMLNTAAGDHKTWNLRASPALFVGTLVRHALTTLARPESNPIPLHILSITSPARTPLQGYLQTYASGFRRLSTLEAPALCEDEKSERLQECQVQRSQNWQDLAKEVLNFEKGAIPSDVVILDIEPSDVILFLKYVAAERAERLEHGDVSPTTSPPMMYTDERPLWSTERQVIHSAKIGSNGATTRLQNRFSRMSGHYAKGLIFLVHFNPLSSAAQRFVQTAESVLGTYPSSNLITLVEALGFVDKLAAESRTRLVPVAELGGLGLHHRQHTAGFHFSNQSKTLPRLSIMHMHEAGYFVDSD